MHHLHGDNRVCRFTDYVILELVSVGQELQMQVSGTSLNSKLNFLQTEVEELKYKLDNRSVS